MHQRESDDLVTADADPRQPRANGRWALLGVITVATIVGVTTVQARPDQPVRVAASGPGYLETSTSTAPDLPVITPETPTTAIATTSTVPTTTSSTTEPRPTTTTTARSAGAPTITTEPHPNHWSDAFSPLPAGGAIFAYEPGRSVWEATSRGYDIRVRVDPPGPRAGQVVHFHVDVSGPRGTPCCIVMTDGGQRGVTRDGVCLAESTFETPFVYNTAGLQLFQVTADDCSGDYSNTGWLSGWLQVSEGKSSVQGPAPPTVSKIYGRMSADHRDDSRYASISYVYARDDDGWITALVIDWGDGGQPETFPGDPSPCKAMPPLGWPQTSMFDTIEPVSPGFGDPPPYEGPPTFDHFYETPGAYTVTVTARSTACDGSQLQEGPGATLDWTVWNKPSY